ncbi:4-hydroxy-tetrahydrodipicolinate synthase [Bacteroidota bacterium]
MRKNIFQGTITALVTPFKKNHSIDFEALKKLIKFQVKSKVDAILVAGTTGESATLTLNEKIELIAKSVEYVNGKVPVIVGTGSNSTADTINLTTIAKELGADAALIVAPYYNKPTQNGIFEHYRLISEKVEIPQIIYNVPGRTSINIISDTQIRLAESCPNIIGTKEASGNLGQMMEIIRHAPANFNVLSGDDALTLPSISIGARGCVSVISNYAPAAFGKMVNLALNNKFKEAEKLHYKLLDLMNLNFIESNPIPVKYILSQMGFIREIYRMPLTPLQPQSKNKINTALKAVILK